MASRLFRKFAPEVMIAFSLALVAVALAGVFLFDAEPYVLDILGWVEVHEILGPGIFGLVSFLKTSSAAEFLAFQPTAGYRPRHANNRHDPRRLRP